MCENGVSDQNSEGSRTSAQHWSATFYWELNIVTWSIRHGQWCASTSRIPPPSPVRGTQNREKHPENVWYLVKVVPSDTLHQPELCEFSRYRAVIWHRCNTRWPLQVFIRWQLWGHPPPPKISSAPQWKFDQKVHNRCILGLGCWPATLNQPWISSKKRLTLYCRADQGKHDTSNQKPLSRGVTRLCACAKTCKTSRFFGHFGSTSGRRSGSFWPSHTLKTVLERSRQPSFFQTNDHNGIWTHIEAKAGNSKRFGAAIHRLAVTRMA